MVWNQNASTDSPVPPLTWVSLYRMVWSLSSSPEQVPCHLWRGEQMSKHRAGRDIWQSWASKALSLNISLLL